MTTPKIYYASSSDYVAVPLATLLFPSTQDVPCIAATAKYNTASARSLDGSVRSVQVHDGRARFVLSFRLFTDAFWTQFLAFVQTIRGTRFPFIYVDTDGILYFLRFLADPLCSGVRYNLNEAVSLELEGAIAAASINMGRGDLTAKTDPEGRIITDPDGNPVLVWS